MHLNKTYTHSITSGIKNTRPFRFFYRKKNPNIIFHESQVQKDELKFYMIYNYDKTQIKKML